MASISTTAAIHDARLGLGDEKQGSPLSDYATRLRRARLGLFVALTPVLMLFVSFTSAYVVRQGLPTLDPHTNQMVRDWIPVELPNLLLANTCILLLSTVSMELARRQRKRETALSATAPFTDNLLSEGKALPWLGLTMLLGICFLAGQWLAWRELARRGFYVATSPSSSFIYLLTGTHAIHLMGGILALAVAGGAALLRRPAGTRGILVDVTAWYWHFMALLWIYIFCLLKFAH